MSARDDGFTLPELLMSIVIIGIILSGVAGGLWTVLHNHQASARQIGGSVDAQVLASWLLPDVQSATPGAAGVDISPAAAAGCTGVPTSTNVVRLVWAESSSANAYAANYRTEQATATAPWQLVRYFCVNGGAAQRVVVVRNLQSAGAATVVNTGTRLGLDVVTSVEGVTHSFTVAGTRRAVAGPSPSTSNPPN
jgi:prepilin-type N-terminal cleavage/methylation domain-containing protein